MKIKIIFLWSISVLSIFQVYSQSINNINPLVILEEINRSQTLNKLTSTEKEKGWQLLFDGKTFSGWHGYNMQGIPDCWIIEDNSLTMKTVNTRENRDIITDKIYDKFALFVEFRMSEGANSGIIIQVSEKNKYKFPYETGPEFQIVDHENWPNSLKDSRLCGANYEMYPPKVKSYKPAGEWNQAFIVVNGSKVTFLLNGKITVEYEKYSDEWKKLRQSGKWADFPDYSKYDKGHISLQNHGAKVWFRNIKIKEL